jgi:hypothetical protein
MTKEINIDLGSGDWMKVELCDRSGLVHGRLTSNLKDNGVMDEEDVAFNAAIDGLESLVLAHACAGVDVDGEDYRHGVVTALETIANKF